MSTCIEVNCYSPVAEDSISRCAYHAEEHKKWVKNRKKPAATPKPDYGEVVKSDYKLTDVCNICGHDKINGECACTYVNKEKPIGKKACGCLVGVEECAECSPKIYTVIDAFVDVTETLKKLPGDNDAERVIKAVAILLEIDL